VSLGPIRVPRRISPFWTVRVWLAAGLFLLPGFARASTIAYDNDTSLGDVGFLQYFQGDLGLDFNVNVPITVTALGVYDQGVIANLDGVFGGGVSVAIFDVNTTLAVTPTVVFSSSNAGVQINGDAFLPESIVLMPGQYSVVTYADIDYNEGYVSTTFNPTSVENSGGGAISFVGPGRFYNTGALEFPIFVDSGPTNRYDAGTFAFVTSPEPSSLMLLLGAAIAGLAPFAIACRASPRAKRAARTGLAGEGKTDRRISANRCASLFLPPLY